MSDSKEWVTIKIPKETRDKAQDDERTYDEIMQAGLGEGPVSDSNPDLDELEDRIVVRLARETQADLETFEHKLDQIQNAQAGTVSEALEIAEDVDIGEVDESELALATADYLMTEYDLPAKVAQEMPRQ